METPVILPGEQIVFLRTVENIPDCFTKAEWHDLRKNYIHELGYLSNVSPDYETVLREGMLALRERGDDYVKREIDAIFALSDRYRDEAIRQSRQDVADILTRIPRQGATTFREALQLFRILHFSLWLEGNYHITTGRFDQYAYPYLKADLEAGRLTEDEALELVKDFFLSFNKDNDTYVGVQQGDNGQSMVLGGMTEEGADGFNLLSRLCLQASRENLMIDPKINLRVSSETPDEIYELGTQLTKAGLGFPQYSNDDVVIDALYGSEISLKRLDVYAELVIIADDDRYIFVCMCYADVCDAVLQIRLSVVMMVEIHLLFEHFVKKRPYREFLPSLAFATEEHDFLHLIRRDGNEVQKFFFAFGYLPYGYLSLVF